MSEVNVKRADASGPCSNTDRVEALRAAAGVKGKVEMAQV
jgi:hypothetical protein